MFSNWQILLKYHRQTFYTVNYLLKEVHAVSKISGEQLFACIAVLPRFRASENGDALSKNELTPGSSVMVEVKGESYPVEIVEVIKREHL